MSQSETYEEMMYRHRKERKDLIGKATQMRSSVSRNDKKKKKELTAEITKMMEDLDLIQKSEIHDFKGEVPKKTPQSEESFSCHCLREIANGTLPEAEPTPKKLSKAQKRRNKKAEQAKERERTIAEQEILNLSGSRVLEMQAIQSKLAQRNLILHEVPSDGNCLYNAIQHQLEVLGVQKTTLKALRESTSAYLLSHQEDYMPFITDPNTGDSLTKEQYVKYCEDIKSTSSWGGHVEIEALACILQKPIEVIQAEGPSVIAGNQGQTPRLIISYHRHAYGLGEHYNSVVPEIFPAAT